MVRCRRSTLRLARGLLAFLFALSVLPATVGHGAPPDPPLDRRFGIVEAFWSPDQATEIGVGWERVVFFWRALQPTSPDDWNQFYFPDEALAREMGQGREVVGLLQSAPAWASGGDDPRLPPKNLYLPYDDPNNYWGAFVKKIASRYRGRIDTWIIWNEPDIWDARRSSSTWLGSEADYYQLLKVAYQAIKSVNPSGKVGFAGLTYWWDKEFGRELYLKRVLEVAVQDPSARANGFYFDFVNVHLYNLPQQMYTVPQQFKQVLARYDLAKPVWLSEMNVVPHDDPVGPLPRASYRANLDEQASFVIQALALSMAGGVERVALYKMLDDVGQAPGSESFGLTRSDGSARPAFAALRAATKYLAGAKDARWVRSGDLNSVVVPRSGETTTVLWNGGAKPLLASIPASAASGLIVDKYGLGATIAPVNGKYFILLPPATAAAPAGDLQGYFIGGDPFMLVESVTKTVDLAPSPINEQPAPAQAQPKEEVKPPPARDTAKEDQARAEQAARALAQQDQLTADQQRTVQDEAQRRLLVVTLTGEARSLIDRYDWQAASVKLQEISQLDPQNPEALALQSVLQREVRSQELQSRAAELYRLQDWAGAAEALRQLVLLHPDDAMLRAQWESALAESEKVRLLSLADDYVSQGRLDEAQQTYDAILSRDPLNRRALDGAANLQVFRWNQTRAQ